MNAGANQIDLSNAQGNLQNQNSNTTNLLNTVNQDSQRRNQSNLLYLQDRARGKELYNRNRNALVENMLTNWRAVAQNKRDEQLMSMLSNNYDMDRNGIPQYIKGRGHTNDYGNLDAFANTKERELAMYRAKIKELENK